MLERERKEFLQMLSKECSKRRIVETQLLDVQEQLRQLQMNYDRLINPLEQMECACAMQDETDLTILRDALNVVIGVWRLWIGEIGPSAGARKTARSDEGAAADR